MYCSNCGANIPQGHRFCSNCGAVQDQSPVPIRQKKQLPWGRVICAAVLLTAAVLTAVLVIPRLVSNLFGTVKLYAVTGETHYMQGVAYQRVEYEYDQFAQLTSVSYDLGDTQEVWDPELDIHRYVYEEYDGNPEETCNFSYDDMGNPDRIKDQKQGKCSISYDYDRNGLMEGYKTQVVYSNSLSAVMELELDYDKDKVVAVYNVTNGQHLRTEAYEYDQEGRLIAETVYAYDRTDRTEYTYDGNRLVQRTYYRGNPAVFSGDTEIQYTRMTETEYTYDSKGRLILETVKPRQGNRSETEYKYDVFGQLTERIRDGVREVYSYDRQGNIVEVRTGEDEWVEYEYEVIEVTRQQAEKYRIRQKMHRDYYNSATVYWTGIYRYLIENPVWDMDPVDIP